MAKAKNFLAKVEFVIPRSLDIEAEGVVRNGKRTSFNLGNGEKDLPQGIGALSEIEKGAWYQVMISSFDPSGLEVFFITGEDKTVVLEPLFSRRIRNGSGKERNLYFWPTCRTVPEKGPRQVFVASRHKMGRTPILKVERLFLGFKGEKPFLQEEVLFESFVSQKTTLPEEIKEMEEYLLDWVQQG